MIYIITALYQEASPIIRYYGLKKNLSFTKNDVFENESFRLIITGTGKIQSAIGLVSVLAKAGDAEKILNVGICGSADPSFAVGELILVHEVKDFASKKRYYPDILYDFGVRGAAVTTFDRPLIATEIEMPNRLEIVDMEASGFYEAAIRYVTAEKVQILKVVSDHLEGNRCTPDLVETILQKNLPTIIKVIEHKKQTLVLLTEDEKKFLEEVARTLRFTETQKHGFLDMAKSYKIRTGKDFGILESYIQLEVTHKEQVKEHFGSIRSLLFA